MTKIRDHTKCDRCAHCITKWPNVASVTCNNEITKPHGQATLVFFGFASTSDWSWWFGYRKL